MDDVTSLSQTYEIEHGQRLSFPAAIKALTWNNRPLSLMTELYFAKANLKLSPSLILASKLNLLIKLWAKLTLKRICNKEYSRSKWL